MARVAAIAIDAAERWYVEDLMRSGKLPNLSRLRARGAWAELESPMAYRSELAWARFLTASEPMEANDWATCPTFEPSTYSLAGNPVSERAPFYALGDDATVVALDLIHSRPADGVRGVQVAGWGAHSLQWPRSSSPPGLLTQIEERFGNNPALLNDSAFGWHDPDYLRALSDACRIGLERRIDAAEWLLTERQPDWDLFLTCLSEVHTAGHQMWHGVDPTHPLHGLATEGVAAPLMERSVVEADQAVGRLLRTVGDDTAVVVFALHGLSPGNDVVATTLLPELFARLHLGRSFLADPDRDEWVAAGCPPLVPPAEVSIGDLPMYAFADTPRQRARRFGHRVVPPKAWTALRRLAGRPARQPLSAMSNPIPPEVVDPDESVMAEFRRPADYQPAAWYQRHWHRMPYFALPSFADAHIRVNLIGREGRGIVQPDDYRAVLAEAEATVRACRDPRTGAPIVADTIFPRANDPFDPDGPDADMLIVLEGAPDAVVHPEVGMVGPFPQQRTSVHSSEGWALVAGPGVPPGEVGRHASAAVPPTILELLGRPAMAQGSLLAGRLSGR